METIGNRIVNLRKQKGLTQEVVSEQAGINLRTLQRIEKGDTEPRCDTLRRLCDVLQIPIEELTDAEKTENRDSIMGLHLSVLSAFFIPIIGQLLFPFILWITMRNKVKDFYEQGANVLNFQIWACALYCGTLIWGVVSMQLFYMIARGDNWQILLIWGGQYLVFFGIWPVINTILIYRGVNLRPFYPWVIRFIK